MDIEQMKKYYKNKINAENLTKKVRDTIKLVDWQKQDMREGFTESFSPLIKSQESIKKSIDDQQNATIAQLRANQLALTDKENKLGELITAVFSITDGKPSSDQASLEGSEKYEELKKEIEKNKRENEEKRRKIDKLKKDFEKRQEITTITPDYFDKGLNNKETIDVLERYGYEKLPSAFFHEDVTNIYGYLDDVVKEVNELKDELKNTANIVLKDGIYIASPKNESPRSTTLQNINDFNILSRYQYAINRLHEFKNVQKGKGVGGVPPPYDPPAINNYKSATQLVDRLELLAGSISAGNNGVINEFFQIAHLLAQMSVITKKQLNKLLKWGLSLN